MGIFMGMSFLWLAGGVGRRGLDGRGRSCWRGEWVVNGRLELSVSVAIYPPLTYSRTWFSSKRPSSFGGGMVT
jgi:hypothetical protein